MLHGLYEHSISRLLNLKEPCQFELSKPSRLAKWLNLHGWDSLKLDFYFLN